MGARGDGLREEIRSGDKRYRTVAPLDILNRIMYLYTREGFRSMTLIKDEAEIDLLRRQIGELSSQWKRIKSEWLDRKYRRDQQRVPAGSAAGGQ